MLQEELEEKLEIIVKLLTDEIHANSYLCYKTDIGYIIAYHDTELTNILYFFKRIMRYVIQYELSCIITESSNIHTYKKDDSDISELTILLEGYHAEYKSWTELGITFLFPFPWIEKVNTNFYVYI